MSRMVRPIYSRASEQDFFGSFGVGEQCSCNIVGEGGYAVEKMAMVWNLVVLNPWQCACDGSLQKGGYKVIVSTLPDVHWRVKRIR